MLIMPSTDKNFQAMADSIVSEFFSQGTSLEDGVVKVALDRDLLPEEVRRLVEKSNTAASVQLLKTAENRKAVFTLATLEGVLSRTHPAQEPVVEKTASLYSGLPQSRAVPERVLEKAAAAQDPAPKNDQPLVKCFVLRQELERARQEKVACECRLQDNIDLLASEFSVWNGPDFGKFASESAALCGDVAMPVLQHLARYLRAPLHLEKVAGVIDDRKPLLGTMREICSGLRNLVKLGSDISLMEQAERHYWREACGARA